MRKVQVFLMTHDRPKLVVQTVASILAQSFSDFHLIISDNSSNDETKKIFSQSLPPETSYIFRNNITGLEHLNAIFHEANSEYFMIFHDDDLMLENCLATLVPELDSNPKLAAVAGNALILRETRKSNKKAFKGSKDILIENPSQLTRKYIEKGYIAPLPGYLFRNSALKGFSVKETCGKHSDIILLFDILKRGKLLWKPGPVMYFRMHSAQCSASFPLGDRRAFLKIVLLTTNFKRNSPIVANFRVPIILKHYLRKFLTQPNKRDFFRLLKIFYLQFKIVPFQIPFGLLRVFQNIFFPDGLFAGKN